MGSILSKNSPMSLAVQSGPQGVHVKDGWLLTGDVGYMDERGYFFVVDRKKDMIIAGGFNIYPREIEEVLYEHRRNRSSIRISGSG